MCFIGLFYRYNDKVVTSTVTLNMEVICLASEGEQEEFLTENVSKVCQFYSVLSSKGNFMS